LGLRHKYYAITITVSDDNTQSVIERNYNMEEILLIVVLLALAFLQSTRAARHTLLIMQNKRVFI